VCRCSIAHIVAANNPSPFFSRKMDAVRAAEDAAENMKGIPLHLKL